MSLDQMAIQLAQQSPTALVLLWAVVTLSRRMDALNSTLITTLDRLATAALRAPEK